MKSKKWALKILKDVLVGYNRHTIYQIHIKDQNKVIQVKNLCIFKDYEIKASTKLLDYNEDKLMFQGFLSEGNNDEKSEELINTCHKDWEVKKAKKKQFTHIELINTYNNGQKVRDTKRK